MKCQFRCAFCCATIFASPPDEEQLMKSSRQASRQTEGAVNNVLSLRALVAGIIGILIWSLSFLPSNSFSFFAVRAAAVHRGGAGFPGKAANADAGLVST